MEKMGPQVYKSDKYLLKRVLKKSGFPKYSEIPGVALKNENSSEIYSKTNSLFS